MAAPQTRRIHLILPTRQPTTYSFFSTQSQIETNPKIPIQLHNHSRQPSDSSFRSLKMITDNQLYSLAIFLGSFAMVLIVIYHWLEVNAIDTPDSAVVEGKEEKQRGEFETPASDRKGSSGAKR